MRLEVRCQGNIKVDIISGRSLRRLPAGGVKNQPIKVWIEGHSDTGERGPTSALTSPNREDSQVLRIPQIVSNSGYSKTGYLRKTEASAYDSCLTLPHPYEWLRNEAQTIKHTLMALGKLGQRNRSMVQELSFLNGVAEHVSHGGLKKIFCSSLWRVLLV